MHQDAELGPYQKTLQGRDISSLTTFKGAGMLQLQSFLKINEEYVKVQIKQIKSRNHSFLMCKKPLLQVSAGRKRLVACLISELRGLQVLTVVHLLCLSSDGQEPAPIQELCRHKSKVIISKWPSCGS